MTTRFQELKDKLALQAAVSNIEAYCRPTNEDGSEASGPRHGATCWYDITCIEENDGSAEEYVADAIELLESCGLLKRHHVNVHWVRPCVRGRK